MSSSSGACTTTRGRTAALRRRPTAHPIALTRSAPGRVHQCVVQALVVGHVPDAHLTPAPLRRVLSSRSSAVTRPTRTRLRHGVVVLGERHPYRPPRVVEPQCPALELPGRRAAHDHVSHRPPRHRHPASPRQPPPRARRRPGLASASSCARCQAANSRAWRTLQWADASRNAASLEGDATSANGSTRSNDSSPTPAPRPGTATTPVDRRTHPLTGRRRAHAALPGDPGDHRDGAVPPPPLRPIELGDVGQLLPVQRRDPRRPLHDPPRQLLRAGVAAEVAAWRPAPKRPGFRVPLGAVGTAGAVGASSVPTRTNGR